jgi:hypothetical protein
LSGIEIQSLAGDLHSRDWNSVAFYRIYTSGIDSTEFHSLAVIFIPGDLNLMAVHSLVSDFIMKIQRERRRKGKRQGNGIKRNGPASKGTKGTPVDPSSDVCLSSLFRQKRMAPFVLSRIQ